MSRHDAQGLCRNDVQILYETRRVEIFFLAEIRRCRDGCTLCSCQSAADAKCRDLCRLSGSLIIRCLECCLKHNEIRTNFWDGPKTFLPWQGTEMMMGHTFSLKPICFFHTHALTHSRIHVITHSHTHAFAHTQPRCIQLPHAPDCSYLRYLGSTLVLCA